MTVKRRDVTRAGGRGQERRSGGQPLLNLLQGRCDVQPPFLNCSRRKLRAQLRVPGPLLGGDGSNGRQRFACHVFDGGGHNVLPNSTFNACGS